MGLQYPKMKIAFIVVNALQKCAVRVSRLSETQLDTFQNTRVTVSGVFRSDFSEKLDAPT